MIRRLIIHIGRHKSGTSAIQLYLAEHRAAYASDGVIIPEFGCEEGTDNDPSDRVAHHRVAIAFSSDSESGHAEQEKWRTALHAAAERGHTVVLSSEAFQNHVDLSALRRLCRGFYVEIVCYFREYLDYALSAYAQEIKKNGLSAGFFEFERTFSPMLPPFIRRWEEFANICHWRLYDQDRLIGGEVIGDFLATAGLPDFGGSRYRATNPRIGGSLLGFKLLANAAGLHSRALGRALEPLTAKKPNFRQPWRLLPETQAFLRSRRDYNAVLASRFGNFELCDTSSGALPFSSPTLTNDFESILMELDRFPELRSHPLFNAFLERAPSLPANL
ncbi:MAG: hypothetical protein F9K30_23520 [Dechloromonas sp.]|nr:MAG: hypothetical protein F9K30_23520 [Dechloromonas sp.]